MAFPNTVYLSYGMEKAITSGQKHKLGTRAETPDGRVFYYAKEDGTGIANAGLIVDNVAAVGDHDMDVPTTAAHSVGDTTISIEVPTTDLTANQYKDGYMVINDGPGQGEVYRIKSPPAHDASDDNTVIFTIDEEDGIRTALTTASLWGIFYNPYSAVKLIDGDGTQTTGPLGVTTAGVTASYYCWLQTSGIASVLVSGTTVMVLGDAIEVSQVSGQSGAATLHDSSGATDLMPIGSAMSVASAAGDYGLVMLSIRN